MDKVEQTVQQLEFQGKPKRKRWESKKEAERLGRVGMLILLLVTSLIPLGFYLKYKIGEVGVSLPQVPEISIGGSEIITIEK